MNASEMIDWPEGITSKARQLLERRFTVGRVTAESCEPGDEPFIGCVAADYEGSGDLGWLTTSAKDIINELAERDLLVGVRQPLQRHEYRGEVKFRMRLMVRPDTAGAVLAMMAEQGAAAAPYMDESTRSHIPGPAQAVHRFGITGLPDGVIHELRGEIGKKGEVATKCRPNHLHWMVGFWNGPRPDLPEGMERATLCGECFPGWTLSRGQAYPPLVAARTVISPPGAAVEVTELKLTPEARRAAKPDLKPFSWWRMALAWLAFNTYVFTGSRHAHMVMEWAMGPTHA